VFVRQFVLNETVNSLYSAVLFKPFHWNCRKLRYRLMELFNVNKITTIRAIDAVKIV